MNNELRQQARLCLRPLAWTIALMAGAAHATGGAQIASVDRLLDMGLEDLMAVKVVTASRTVEALINAPAPVTVVTGEDIRSHGWRTLADVLRSMPGLHVSYDRQYQYLGVRGINRKDFNSRLLVLIDGRRTNENIYEQGFIEGAFAVDLEAVERIEFVSGPGSSLYGNNAMLGVVNVVTRQATDMAGGRIVTEVASQSSRRLYAEYGRVLEGGAQLGLNASTQERKGRDLVFPEQAATNDGIAQGLDGERIHKFFGQYAHQGWRLQVGAMERTKQDPTALFASVFADAMARFSDQLSFVSVARDMQLAADTEARVQLTQNNYRYRNQYHYASAIPDPVNQDFNRGQWWNAQAQLSHTGWRGHRVIAGLELQRDTRQEYSNEDLDPSFVYVSQSGRSRKLAVFVDDAITLDSRWQLDIGLRWDQYHTRTRITSCDMLPCSTSGLDNTGVRRSPRAALIYRPGDRTTLKLMTGRAFRAPNPGEMVYFTPAGTATIGQAVAESFHSHEASVEHFVHPNYKLWANVFRYQLKGVIGRDATDTYVNLNDIHSSGVVLGLDWKGQQGERMRASVSHSRSHDPATHARVDDAPVNLVKLNYSLPLPDRRWRMGVELQSHSSRVSLAGQQVEGASLLNLTLASSKLWKNADVSISVYNLLGRRYADPATDDPSPIDQIPQDGRTLRVQLEWRF